MPYIYRKYNSQKFTVKKNKKFINYDILIFFNYD